MKYNSPSKPFVLTGPYRLVCINSNGCDAKCSFVLNWTFVCLPCRQASHSVLEGFQIFGISRTTSFLLILTRLSKFMWLIHLCHNQLSSSLASRHALVASSRTYMSFGARLAVATILPYPPFLISNFVELNSIVCPWSHICPTLGRLWFMFSTNKTFLAITSFLSRVTVLDPITLKIHHFQRIWFHPSSLLEIQISFYLQSYALSNRCQHTTHICCFKPWEREHNYQSSSSSMFVHSVALNILLEDFQVYSLWLCVQSFNICNIQYYFLNVQIYWCFVEPWEFHIWQISWNCIRS